MLSQEPGDIFSGENSVAPRSSAFAERGNSGEDEASILVNLHSALQSTSLYPVLQTPSFTELLHFAFLLFQKKETLETVTTRGY
jgi:hypothetical protein